MSGECENGKNCAFAHGIDELSSDFAQPNQEEEKKEEKATMTNANVFDSIDEFGATNFGLLESKIWRKVLMDK